MVNKYPEEWYYSSEMRYKKPILLLLVALLCSWQPALAQEYGLQDTLKRMADLLAAQQKQLDEQAKELAEQRALIRQLQGEEPPAKTEPAIAQQPETVPESLAASDTTDSGDAPTAQDQAKQALVEKQADTPTTVQEQVADLQKAMNDPSNTIYDADFRGAWYLPGTTAALKVGGYVNLSLVNSFDPMLIPDRFIVGSIVPDDQTIEGAVKGTSVSANQTRVNLEYREQTSLGEIRAYVEGDFRGGAEDGEDTFRLRHAFGQFRTFLAGKTWSTLMDVDARPEEVDVEGMNGEVLIRHSQIRWSPEFGKNYQLKLALEDPATDVINGQAQRGHFDFVTSLNRMPLGPLGRWNYRVGFVLRDLRADGFVSDPEEEILGAEDSTTGWGITTGGRQPVTWWGDGGDSLAWQLTYGRGIGHYINDLRSVGGGDAVFDPEGKLHALPVFAGFLSYQHIWPMTWKPLKKWPGILRSNINFGVVSINTFDFQEDIDYHETIRASINLFYNPTDHVTMGVEFLWGQRKNHDKSKGSATQLQFSARYTF